VLSYLSTLENTCGIQRRFTNVQVYLTLPYDCITFIANTEWTKCDVICERVLMFVARRLSEESDAVRFVTALYDVLYGGMTSCIGRNVLTCSNLLPVTGQMFT